MTHIGPPTALSDTTPLFGLRVTTPRLTLRLGTTGDVRALGELARRGIHPPEEMPFGVAWSDRTTLPGFLEEFATFHREGLSGWTPDAWRLDLLVWENGVLVGTQGVTGTRFADERIVSTGSWLGREAQGRGIGTEMRAAALELAFRGLRAEAATSGWLQGNAASGRVSEKLGYRETGISEISPRGTPVPHHDVRIERVDWYSPVEVEITGLGDCLALFGAAQPIERNAAESD
jgi:RimJ/RimL family protein N-acetyltransferase